MMRRDPQNWILLASLLALVLTAAFVGIARGAGLPKQITGTDGAPLVLVPAGEFVMGSTPGGYIFGDNETPRRRIYLKAFYIDKYEITNRRFRKFFAPVERYAGSFEEPEQPVVGVTWFQARDYCARVGRRLPTEAQWEKTARGADGRTYPWGDERATCARAVMGGEIPSCSKGFATWSVGSRPLGASPFGAMDMAGNAMEWVADWYRGNFYAQMPGKNPKGPGAGSLKVLRGGAWFNSRFLMRSAFRTGYAPYESNHGVGFRCARPAVVGVVRRTGAGGG